MKRNTRYPLAPPTRYEELVYEIGRTDFFKEPPSDAEELREKENALKSIAVFVLLQENKKNIIRGDTVEYDPENKMITVVTGPFGTKPVPTVRSVRAIVRDIMVENRVPPDYRPAVKKVEIKARNIMDLAL